jgi:hypothetical protein
MAPAGAGSHLYRSERQPGGGLAGSKWRKEFDRGFSCPLQKLGRGRRTSPTAHHPPGRPFVRSIQTLSHGRFSPAPGAERAPQQDFWLEAQCGRA